MAVVLTHLASTFKSLFTSTDTHTAGVTQVMDEWKDDIWPWRPPTAWDISTDFPYPRLLEYDVEEGTWLRLDVHPTTGEIVFDMLGDLYCLPVHSYAHHRAMKTRESRVSRAHPILRGVPHDSDPHFSPNGDRIVFRSDAELGVENIWVMRWLGCERMDLERVDAITPDGNADMLARGIRETTERRKRRLMREGRLGGKYISATMMSICVSILTSSLPARRVTNETYRFLSDARFHPSQNKVVATKWYTSSRSLGAGEGWEYPVPSFDELAADGQKAIEAGSGKRIIKRNLPAGWGQGQYGNQQIGPEQFIWRDDDVLIYSMNVKDSSTFTYSKGSTFTYS